MANRSIGIVSVNYKTAKLVCNAIACLLLNTDSKRFISVFVIDNDSQDGSAPTIQNYIDDQALDNVNLITMPKNGGFAYGSNAGIREAISIGCDYIMLLNPDTEVRQNAIKHLANYLDQHPKVGVVGSQLENSDGEIENSAHQFHSPFGEFVESARLGLLERLFPNYVLTPEKNQGPYQCDWVSGASMMVRREVFEEIGLLDEAYFLYFEEVDFFYRLQQAGWESWYVPESQVMHIEGASTDIKSRKRRPVYWYDSRRRFFIKHYGVFGLIFADFFWTIGRASYQVRRILRLGAQKENNDPKWFMYDLLRGDILSVLSGRAWRLPKQKVN